MKYFLYLFLCTFIFTGFFAGFILFLNITYIDNSYVWYDFKGSTPGTFDILLIGFRSVAQLIFSLVFSVIFSFFAILVIKKKFKDVNLRKIGSLTFALTLILGALYLLTRVFLLIVNEISSPLFWQEAFTSFVIVMMCFLPVAFLLSWLLFKKFSKVI